MVRVSTYKMETWSPTGHLRCLRRLGHDWECVDPLSWKIQCQQCGRRRDVLSNLDIAVIFVVVTLVAVVVLIKRAVARGKGVIAR